MALRYREKVLLAGIETTYGIDPTLTGVANAIYAHDISIQPMQGQDVDRGHETPWLGNAAMIPADLHMVMTFKVELVPSGTAGTVPGWGPLMRACGVAETIVVGTSVTYNPVTDGHESATITLNIAGILYKLIGARGNCEVVKNASGIPQLEFTFTGLWTKPVDQAKPTPDYSAFQAPLVVSKVNTPTLTIDGASFVGRNFKLAMGNQVEGRFLIGAEEIVIVDRAETLEMQIEATPIATFDPYAAARDGTALAVQIVHGTQAGAIATLAVPQAQMQRPDSPTEAQGIVEWPLRMLPLPDTGNDQWTLTLT
ncbi:phage tail tube protein [Citreimonas salinaria]|uniref:Phage tail protein n=1 Tax=Citreimonas salinaria TaxID=321339 RepID=A0A1H3KTE1_9RHOB|nr:phage tail tube protein [Citreimonas salinaria]SDY55443.1 hypothetical protein SAMN05444340_110100 [Citreimonas salinaria]